MGHLSAAANEIEEFGVNMLDAGHVSELLKERQGVTLWKLRDAADELMRIKAVAEEKAALFERFLKGEITLEDDDDGTRNSSPA